MRCRAFWRATALGLLAIAGTTALAASPTRVARRAADDASPVPTQAPDAGPVAEEPSPPAPNAASDDAAPPADSSAGGPEENIPTPPAGGSSWDDPYLRSGGYDNDGGPLGGCDLGCGQGCGCCLPPHGLYAGADYLYWWVQGMNTPALATTSPVGTAQGSAGDLPGATVLDGGNRINGQGRSGGRFTLGYWFDPNQTIGIESQSFFLQQTHTSYNSGVSQGTPILARPFYDVNTGAQNSDLIAFPGLVAGQITTAATTKVFGTEVNLRRALSGNGPVRLDGMIGYRFMRFDEGLGIQTVSSSTATGGSVPVGTTFNIRDNFGTQNMFNGLNLGLRWMYDRGGRWSFDAAPKVAVGAMQQQVSIQGNTVTTVPGYAPTHANGGILALPRDAYGGNIGTYSRNRFAAIPELQLNLHYQLRRNVRLNVGYTLLFLTDVVRPGSEIDPRVDTNRFPPVLPTTSAFPQFSWNQQSVWIQGINLGAEVRF